MDLREVNNFTFRGQFEDVLNTIEKTGLTELF